MPAYKPDQLPITAQESGFVQRSIEAGDLLLAFEHVPKGDYAAQFADLPGGQCQSPHWGYMIRGKIRIKYADREEIFEAGQAYYIPPGHVPEVLEDADVVEFSEPAAYHQTIDIALKGQHEQPGQQVR